MLGTPMGVHRILIAINFPQGEYIRLFLAAAHLESDNSGFFDRRVA